MRKSIKKIIAVTSAFALAVTGISYNPVSTSAADFVSVGEADAPVGNWSLYAANGSWTVGSMSYSGTGTIINNDIDMTLRIDQSSGNAGSWGLQAKYPVTGLDNTKLYQITVNYSSTAAGVMLIKAEENGTQNGSAENFNTVIGENTYVRQIHNVTQSQLVFELSGMPANAEIDFESITFEEIEDTYQWDGITHEITIVPNTAQIESTSHIWANWTNPANTEKAYVYLNNQGETYTDDNHAAATANNGWIFNYNAGQPMIAVDQVAQTKDGSIIVDDGQTYTLIVQALDKNGNLVGQGSVDITMPSVDVVGGPVEFTSAYRNDFEVNGVTYYGLYANWNSVPGAKGYKSYINEVAAGNECKAANGWVWSDNPATTGSTDTHVDTVWTTKSGNIVIDENTDYTLIIIACDKDGVEIGRGSVVLAGKGGENPTESSSSEEETSEQGGNTDYDNLDWVVAQNNDNYAVAMVGYPADGNIQFAIDQGANFYVATTANTIKPDYKAETVNGVAVDTVNAGANFWVPMNMLNDNAYNEVVIVDGVNNTYTFIVRVGNPGGSSSVVTNDLKITGYQVNTTGVTSGETTYEFGMRTLYQMPATVEGKSTTGCEFGLVYGLGGKVAMDDVTLDNLGKYVVKNQGTDIGACGNDPTGVPYYAMTFATNVTNVTKAHLSRVYYVRSYVIIDGVTYYSEVKQMSAFKVADNIYKNQLATNAAQHKFLYDNILKVLDPTYVETDFTGLN